MPDFGVFAAWSSRKRIDLPIPTADQAGFPAKVPIVADADMAEALANGHDIRFVAADGVTELPYERNEWSGGGGFAVTAIFWVKTDVAMAGTYLYVYYGNAAASDGEDAGNVWDTDFKAVYHMNDATTSTILDSTANHNDGTKKGANEPIEATGKIGQGQDFDGTDDYITRADNATLDIVAPISIEAWIKPDTITGQDSIVCKGDGDAHYHYDMDLGDGYLRLHGSGGTTLAAVSTISAGSWSHVVAVNAGGITSLYINGALNISDTGSIGAPDGNPLWIGYEGYSGMGTLFDGLIDEVRISSVARSAEWIAYEYANMGAADGGLTWGSEEHKAVPAGGMKPMDLRLKI